MHIYATSFVTNYSLPHFCRTDIKQLSFLFNTWVQKFGIPFHYPSQAPPLLLILKSVFVT